MKVHKKHFDVGNSSSVWDLWPVPPPPAPLPLCLTVSASSCFPFTLCGTFLATANYRQHISSHLALLHSVPVCLTLQPLKLHALALAIIEARHQSLMGQATRPHLQLWQLWQHNCKLHWAIARPITVLAWKMEQPATRNCQN